MEIFKYGQEEIDYLKGKDKRLARAIDRIGPIKRELIPDLFPALVNSIIGQQISAKAATTVWNRMLDLMAGNITPEKVWSKSVDEIQKCGMSTRKVFYIQDAAEKILTGKFDMDGLKGLPDNEVKKQLSSLNGIGEWTAEMLMLFSMQRPDILSWGDLALKRGIMMLYGHKTLDRTRFDRYRRRYSPYASVASLYLWEISAGK
ncbi:MAG TPA: DNA-3-methyladenine glycosylase 2 family protein [Bacillota bacterium]|nr:DNA-3-methyladenine glycosylase 2 family protein [Bacillota bacterium]